MICPGRHILESRGGGPGPADAAPGAAGARSGRGRRGGLLGDGAAAGRRRLHEDAFDAQKAWPGEHSCVAHTATQLLGEPGQLCGG